MVKWSAYNPWLLGSVLAAYKIILENFVILTCSLRKKMTICKRLPPAQLSNVLGQNL